MRNWRYNPSTLPDIATAENSVVTLPTGEAVRQRKVLKFSKDDIRDTDPVFFSDREGSWSVVRGLEGGPYKNRM